MTRFICLLAIAASVSLAATVATAAGDDWARDDAAAIAPADSNRGVRPDDRASRGAELAPMVAIAQADSNRGLRPDDRASRGAELAPTVAVVQSPSVHVDGFDWADAGIGAAAAVGLGLLLAGGSALVRRRQRVTAFS
jgi:hypothetical protein